MHNVIDKTKVYQAWLCLKITYALVPIVIGLDKCFTWWLVDWAKYTSPAILEKIPFLTLILFVVLTGVIEIVAGIYLWFYPRSGAYIVAAWMLLVIIDLATMNNYYDIIARDTVIGLGALVLAWLTEAQQNPT